MTLRAIQFVIHPTVVNDDGVNLTPVQIEPIVVTAAELPGFAERFVAQMAEHDAAAAQP